ncbi:hypothetical protein LguiB_034514 [Lonicera macranthoides]
MKKEDGVLQSIQSKKLFKDGEIDEREKREKERWSVFPEKGVHEHGEFLEGEVMQAREKYVMM